MTSRLATAWTVVMTVARDVVGAFASSPAVFVLVTVWAY